MGYVREKERSLKTVRCPGSLCLTTVQRDDSSQLGTIFYKLSKEGFSRVRAFVSKVATCASRLAVPLTFFDLRAFTADVTVYAKWEKVFDESSVEPDAPQPGQ